MWAFGRPGERARAKRPSWRARIAEVTLDEFRTAQTRELQQLGADPTEAQVRAAAERVRALGPEPEGASWEAFIAKLEWSKRPRGVPGAGDLGKFASDGSDISIGRR